MRKPDMSSCELLPDEHVEGDETLSSDELTAALIESLQGLKDWNAGRGTARVTYIDDGELTGLQEMFKAEFDEASGNPYAASSKSGTL